VVTFVDWFERSCGDWVSHRRYLYGSQKVIDNLTVHFSLEKVSENEFKLIWCSDRNNGTMEFVLDGEICRRSRSYYKEVGTETKMERVDDDTVVFLSAYDGMVFREEIRLVSGGRLRQTIGWKNEKMSLVGQYWEERVSEKEETDEESK
jgi:hypothetical protein